MIYVCMVVVFFSGCALGYMHGHADGYQAALDAVKELLPRWAR